MSIKRITHDSSSQSLERFNSEKEAQSLLPASRRVSAGRSAAGEGATLISCPPQIVNYGIDTIVICFKIDWRDTSIFEVLSVEKERIQRGTSDSEPVKLTQSGIFSWNLSRSGTRFYPYLLKTGDLTLQLADRPGTSATPNCILRIGSVTCHSDLCSTVDRWKLWMEYLGGRVIEEKCSRIDLCCDVKGYIDQERMTDPSYYISRASKFAAYWSNWRVSGCQLGSGDIVLRVYDKQLEMREKKNSEKTVFFNDLWGTTVKDPVFRVEFQMRGEALKELFPNSLTLDEVLVMQGTVWEYLTTNWCRHTTEQVDRINRNQTRSENSVVWNLVSRVHDNPIPPVRRKRNKHISIEHLTKMARGCLVTMAAAFGIHEDDHLGIVGTVKKILHDDLADYLGTRDFLRKYRKKQLLAVIDF